MNKEDAIAKIRKLLARSGRTDHEIDTAQMLAAAIAEKNGINLAELDLADQRRQSEITHKEVGEWSSAPPEATYASLICQKFFEITTFTQRGWTERVVFVGTALHMEIAEYVFWFLVREFRWQWNHRRGRCRKRKLFMYGAYLAVYQKLHARFAGADGETAVEIAWATKRQQYIDGVFGELTTKSASPKDRRGAAAQRGWMAGKDIEIRPGIASNHKQPQALPGVARLLPPPQ